jgi:hypothetical protein
MIEKNNKGGYRPALVPKPQLSVQVFQEYSSLVKRDQLTDAQVSEVGNQMRRRKEASLRLPKLRNGFSDPNFPSKKWD